MTTRERKILLFLIFLAISFILWFLLSLDEYYNTEIKIPVEFVNVPKNKFIKSGNARTVTLTVNGYGYDIVKYSMKNKISALRVNLNEVRLYPVQKNDSNDYYFLTKDMILQLSSQLSPKIKIISVSPDTIFITFSQLISRHLPIIPDVTITYAKQYINTSPIRIEPDKALVKGPSYIIDTLKYVKTEHIEITNLSHSIKQQIRVLAPPHVKVLPRTTTLIVNVEQYTEARLSVQIKVINLPANYNLLLFPNKIWVRFNVGIKNYKKIRPEHFTAIVDYNDLKTTPGDKLPVKVIHRPKNIYSFSYFPHEVEYILEEKK